MGIFDRFRRAPQIEAKESATRATLVMSPGQPVWTPRDYEAFAKEAYTRNVVAYQCINKIGEALGSIKWTAWRGEAEVTESPLLALLEKPNPKQSTASYLMERAGYELIAGNAYQERIVVGSTPRELYNLRPDRMSVVPDAAGHVARYEYKVGGKRTIWEVSDDGDSDIWHSKTFHPVNDWYGLAPVEAGAYAVDQHNEAMKWMQALLQNSARPSGALVTPEDKDMTDEQYNRLKAQIEEQYSGASNAGRPMLLEGGLDWRAMGLSPDDMAIIETKASAARDIALAFGVPPMLLGIPGDNTYANYSEARLAFWEDTVVPMAMRVANEWSIWLGQAFGGLEVRPEMDHVPAIADKRKVLYDIASRAPFLTVDEQREMVGYKPLPNGAGVGLPMQGLPASEPGEIDAKTIAAALGYPYDPRG